MPKVAILADIHGNLPALDAVLAEIAAEDIERVVCLGDVATLGPQPHEVITRLRGLGCPVVMGNTDADLLALARDESATGGVWGSQDFDFDQWCAARLTADDLAYLRTFQPMISVSLGDGMTLLCYHGSPRSYDERITADTTDDALHEMLAETPAQLYAGGHTHQQLLRRYRGTLVLNPGTVGFAKDAIAPAITAYTTPPGPSTPLSRAMAAGSMSRCAACPSISTHSLPRSTPPAYPASTGGRATGGESEWL